ncbi:Protein LCHN [Pleurostoma richardsiae]|uniref:Protein LCHN n=1 Tax=Pleurostoma richardsiae TaxID=41990 RepID=A0AA38S158_9PEZI|nr:Protein LCHN [Pleurostoma richardsiae]
MSASRRGQPPLSVRLPSAAAPSSSTLLPDLPPISALFLIDFDVKAGYKIIWHRAVPGLELEGAVEYKSLPSGLHTVQDDLIYFVHDGGGDGSGTGHAGLSAFVNTRTDEAEARHARMIAVGVLVPLSYGRLGRAWRHAEGLKRMAAQLVADRKQTQILEQYWEKVRPREKAAAEQPQSGKESPLASPAMSFHQIRPGGAGHARNRSASDGTALMPPGHRLSPYHPAWSLTTLLDTFGPLIFPIHRAALLRKRILISTHAPVHDVCNFVYDISVLANVPLSVIDLLPPSAPSQRLRPLFNIGVHDIPFLMDDHAAAKRYDSAAVDEGNIRDDKGSGWIACTTDSILAVKSELWDVLITMPPPYASNAKERVWPTVEYPKGVQVKATQRDLRRFRSLRAGLRRLAAAGPSAAISASAEGTPRSEAPPGTRRPARLSTSSGRAGFYLSREDDELIADAAEKVVEPVTWAALAYSGFMWWASAGEQGRSDEAEEAAHDATLLADLAPPTPSQTQLRNASVVGLTDSISSLTAAPAEGGSGDGDRPAGEEQDEDEEEEDRARAELAIIAYFHRLTTQALSVLADLVDASDEDDMLDVRGAGAGAGDQDALLQQSHRPGGAEEDEGDGDVEDEGYVRVGSEALAGMGLDVWSAADAAFARELAARYFGRRAYVEGKGVEVCGLRVC